MFKSFEKYLVDLTVLFYEVESYSFSDLLA